MGYARNLVVSIDQLLNTICGGDPDLTISARVGYFARKVDWHPTFIKFNNWYWKEAERIIDWTYAPAGEPNHCRDAYEADPEEDYKSDNRWFLLFLLSLITISVCFVVGPVLNIFCRSDAERTLQSNNGIYEKNKGRLRKGIRWIFIFFILLLMFIIGLVSMLPITILIIILLFTWLVILVIMSIIIIPVFYVAGHFLNIWDSLSFSRGLPLQSNNKIKPKEKRRLKKGIKKFRKVLIKYCPEGANEFDRAVIIMDMLREIFGYYNYSEIESEINSIIKCYILTVKIDNKPEFMLEVSAVPSEFEIYANKQINSYLNKAVEKVILTNGINWIGFTINSGQVTGEFCRFDFQSLDPNNIDDIKLLHSISKECLVESVPEDNRAEGDITKIL